VAVTKALKRRYKEVGMKKVLALVVAFSAAMAMRAIVVRADVNPVVGTDNAVTQDNFSQLQQYCSVATVENSTGCSEAAFCSQNVSHPDCQGFCEAYPSAQACSQKLDTQAFGPRRWCYRHPLFPGCWI
jgi:hypothetical protein